MRSKTDKAGEPWNAIRTLANCSSYFEIKARKPLEAFGKKSNTFLSKWKQADALPKAVAGSPASATALSAAEVTVAEMTSPASVPKHSTVHKACFLSPGQEEEQAPFLRWGWEWSFPHASEADDGLRKMNKGNAICPWSQGPHFCIKSCPDRCSDSVPFMHMLAQEHCLKC